MRRKLLSFAAMLLLTCMVFAVPVSARIDNQVVTGTYHQTEARKVLELVNNFRTGSEACYKNPDNTTYTYLSGLNALQWDYDLERAAMQRAAELSVYFSHMRPNGSFDTSVYRDINSIFLNACTAECIEYANGWYFGNAQSAFDGWREENMSYTGQGHRRAMLDQRYTSVGVAFFEYDGYRYWAMELANKSSGAAPFAANDSQTTLDIPTYLSDVQYNANGGTGAPAMQSKIINTDLRLSTATPYRPGYRFTAWNTAADGSGTTYRPGSYYQSDVDMTLYAQWEPDNSLSIHAEPMDVTLALGQTGNFSVMASGTGLSYQWQYKRATASAWTNSGNATAKTATLSMTADSTRNGMQFRCIVKDSDGNSVTSRAATMTIKAAITSHPKNATVALGESGKFSVTAIGNGLSYQWQYKSAASSTWTNSASSTAKTATLSITADSSRNGMLFRCVVTDSMGNTATSNPATMTVPAKLAITAQPKNVTLALGETGKFTVAASGTGLSYQWQYKSASASAWTNSGASTAKTAALSMAADSTRHGMQFRCIVKDSNGNSVTSSAATMTIKAAITAQPKNVTVALGQTGKFSVTAIGNGLSYQWQYKSATASAWTNSGNATAKTATLEMKADSSRNGMQFRCIVKDSAGNTATSSAAAMTVTAASKLAITSQPKNVTLAMGETGKFTVTASGTGLTYQWQYKSASGSTWTNSGNSTAKTAALSMTADASRAGMQFRCVIKDSSGNTVTSSAATMTIKAAITSQPKNVTLAMGETGKFTVTAAGSGLSYQWQYKSASGSTWTNSGNSSAKTATLSMAADSTRNGMQFRCVVKDSSGNTVTSSAATMTIKAAITSQPKNVTLALGETGKFSVTATGVGLSYQWQYKSASASSWTNSGNSSAKTATLSMSADSTRNGMQFRCIVKDANGFSVTSAAATMTVASAAKLSITQHPQFTCSYGDNNVTFRVEATGTGLNYQWQYRPVNYSTWYNVYSMGVNANWLTVYANADNSGYEYRCVVTDASGNSVASRGAALNVYSPNLELVMYPNTVSVSVGSNAVFSVRAEGTGLSYQWQFRYANMDVWYTSYDKGYNTPNLVIPAYMDMNKAEFRCVIHSSTGETVVSPEAVLIVEP